MITVVAALSLAMVGGPAARDYSCLTNSQWLTGDAEIVWEQHAGECLPEDLRGLADGISAISLTRWSLASYSLTLKRDGSVIYDGFCGAGRLGCHTGRIEAWRFDRLARLIAEIGYFGLDDSYESDATDQQIAVMAVTQFGCVRAVMDYGAVGPPRLWALEEMVSAALDYVDWVD